MLRFDKLKLCSIQHRLCLRVWQTHTPGPQTADLVYQDLGWETGTILM